MSDSRKKISENNQLILFAEVEGVCPNCPNLLMYDKNGRKEKKYEIAHIYPLNPKPDELVLLKDEERLSKDPNHNDNLICLCVDCHTKFDKPRTVEEYRSLFAKKKNLIRRNKEKSIWINTGLEAEISKIIDLLSQKEFDTSLPDKLSYDPKTIDEKTDDTITYLTKRNIHRNVQDYYHSIKLKFIELDKITPLTTETISSQIKSHYLALRKQNKEIDQKEIFDAMVTWLDKNTNQQSKEASEIIVSYFIQNCEIFE
jgi:HNH endonuclease